MQADPSARAVVALFGGALGGIEITIRAILTIGLRILTQRLALLHRDLMSRFGLRHCDLVVALGCRLAGLLRLVSRVVRVVIGLCVRDVLLGIGVIFASVGLSIGDVALRIRPRVGHVMLHFGGDCALLQPASARPAAATIQNTEALIALSSM